MIIPSVDEDILVNIIEQASPSVVNINTVMLMHDAYMNVAPVQGVGSGILIDPKGYILTNHHIAGNAQSMTVSMLDGTKLKGDLVGTDPMTDVAVIKVDPGKHKLPIAQIGDSNQIRVGQTAIAIGNPFGFMLRGPTVTVGVISALNRTIQVESMVFENLIQTDAPINPGNSGGPLLNKDGEVVGMNSASIPYAQGIGFSIPIDTAMHVGKELIEHGKVVRPWLGIFGVGVTKEMAEYYNLSSNQGILVTRVYKNSPAGIQGIAPGDIVLTVDGKTMKEWSDFADYIRAKKVGEEINLVILRGEEKGEATIQLAETPTG